MKVFSKRNITIYTLIILLSSIILFEFGYCNPNFIKSVLKGQEVIYNFSLCRIIIYILFIIMYLVFKNKFIDLAIETLNNKKKRILTYITLVGALVFFAIVLKNLYITKMIYIRADSIKLILALMSTLFIIYISNNVQKNVIVASCTFGIIFTFTTSFNHAIDEKTHFMSALNVSFLNFSYSKNPITDKKIEQLPQLTKFTAIDDFLKNDYIPEVSNEVDRSDIPSNPTTYNFVAYLPSAFGIVIARVLNGSIIDIYILGRLMNLIVYTFLVYWAIKLLPYKKNIFFIIAFMPYMLLLAASYSIDGLCLGTVYIFVAYCLKLYKECEVISLKQFLTLALLFIITMLGKGMGYILICLLVFMLPFYKTIKKNKKHIPTMIICSLLVLIFGVLFVLYMKNTKITGDGDTRGGNGVNPAEQLNVVLTHPIFDVKLAIQHIKVTLCSFGWYCNLHQNTFFTNNNGYTMFIIMLFILYVAVTEDDYNFKIKDKIILVLTFLAIYGMTSAILYLSFTPVGVLYISGYQTRYIFPILPLILSCISNDNLISIKSYNRNMKISIGTGIFLLIGLIQLIAV